MLIPPIYLVDLSGQQWLIAADDAGTEITTVPVSGKSAFASVILNDSETTQAWRLTVVGPGTDWGETNLDELVPQDAPTQLLILSPRGNRFAISVFSGVLSLVPVAGCNPPTSYYLSLITSLYQNSPNFLSWLQAILSIICDINVCIQNMTAAFDVDTAVGVQMDILGQIIGASRVVPFQPSGGGIPILDDDTYRILIRAKIAQNQWNGQASSLYSLWPSLFPGGIIAVQDNQNMTATIFLAGAFTDIAKDLIINGLIVPRPEGVLYNYVFAVLPVFGFDGDHTFIAGFDEGHWA